MDDAQQSSPPDPATASAFGAPGRRRNGRLQACEPCRRRKVSCDHAYPVCRRCRLRQNVDGCVYVAPEAVSRRSSLASGERVRKSTPHRRAVAAGSRGDGRHGQAPPVPTPEEISSRINSPEPHALPSETSPGYLGFTSFHQVYQETQNSLSLIQGASILSSMKSPRSTGSADPAGPSTDPEKPPALTPRTLEMCLLVLRRIPGEDVALSLFLGHSNPNDGWIRLAARRLLESLYAAFGRELRSRRPQDLEDMARIISANTARSLVEDEEPDAERWITSFSGRRMRWECLGVLFTYWSFAALSDQAHRPELVRLFGGDGSGLREDDEHHQPQSIDPRRVTLAYKETAQVCIDLCRGCAPNSLLLYLTFRNAILESVLVGDAAPSFWCRLGEVVARATYLGLHAMATHGEEDLTAASQAKRRLISQIFVVDKVAASFSGRPPLLSRKYMVTSLPLDLSDEVLLAGGEIVTKAAQALDDRGWNQEGKFYPTTIVRARRLRAAITDEIMEFALVEPTYSSTEALLDLKARAYNLLSEMPSALRYDPADIRDLTVPGSTIYAKVVVHIEHLQNLFFVNRLLVLRGQGSQADLLGVSFEMVATTLIFWTHMDRLAELHGDFEWLVMAYAAPAGGILCNELLKPTIHRSPVPGVTKSGIIQQLSLLVGFLDWVSPSAPNGQLCKSCKAVIQHVLDQALNGPPIASSENTASDQAFDFNLDPSMDMGGFFNFDLLDTFDWLRPELNSSQQSQPTELAR